MPTKTFALLLLSVIAAGALTVSVATGSFGISPFIGLTAVLALALIWRLIARRQS